MPSLADDCDYPLTLHQADQARSDFAAIESDLQFVMSQFGSAGKSDRLMIRMVGAMGGRK